MRYIIDTDLTPAQMAEASLLHDKDMVVHFEVVEPRTAPSQVNERTSRVTSSAESTRVCVRVANEAFSALANYLLGELTHKQEKDLATAVESLKEAAEQAEGLAYRMADWSREHRSRAPKNPDALSE